MKRLTLFLLLARASAADTQLVVFLMDDLGVQNQNIYGGGFIDDSGNLRFSVTGFGEAAGSFVGGSITDIANNHQLTVPRPLTSLFTDGSFRAQSDIMTQLTESQSSEIIAGQWTLNISNGQNPMVFTGQIVAVPEPATWGLLGIGLAGFIGARRRVGS